MPLWILIFVLPLIGLIHLIPYPSNLFNILLTSLEIWIAGLLPVAMLIKFLSGSCEVITSDTIEGPCLNNKGLILFIWPIVLPIIGFCGLISYIVNKTPSLDQLKYQLEQTKKTKKVICYEDSLEKQFLDMEK